MNNGISATCDGPLASSSALPSCRRPIITSSSVGSSSSSPLSSASSSSTATTPSAVSWSANTPPFASEESSIAVAAGTGATAYAATSTTSTRTSTAVSTTTATTSATMTTTMNRAEVLLPPKQPQPSDGSTVSARCSCRLCRVVPRRETKRSTMTDRSSSEATTTTTTTTATVRYASRRGNKDQAEEDEEATERLSSVIGDSGVGSAVARGPERYCSHLRRYQRGVRLARLVVCYLLNAVLLIVTTNACFSTEQREGQWFSMTTFVNRSCMVVGTLLPFVGSLLHNVGRDRPPRADTVHMQSVFVGYMVVVIAQSTAYRVQFNYDVEFHMALLSNTTLLTLHGALLLTTAVRRIARCNAPLVQSSQQQQQQPSRLAYSQRPVNAAATNDALRSSRCDCKDTRAVFSAANGEDATLNDTATTFADSSPMSSIIVAATVSRDTTGSKRRTAEEPPPPAARYDVHDSASPAAAAATAAAVDVHVEDKENRVVVDAVDDQSSIPVTPYETLEKLATASLQPYLMLGERFRHDRSRSSDVTAVLIDAEALLREERNNVDRFRRCSGDYVPFDPLVNRSPSSRLDDATVRDDPGHSLLAGDAAREPTSFASELPTATPASSVVVPAVQPPLRRRRRCYRLSCTVDPSTRHLSHRLTSTSSQRTYATTSESDADRCSTRCFAVSEATTTASKEATQSLPRRSLRFLREQSPQPDDRLAYETETVQRSQSQLLGRGSDFRPSRRQQQQQQQQQHHPYHHDPLETVLHEIEQAVDLINDLLDFTQCAATGTASADHVPERPGDESARRCLYEYSPLSRFVEAIVQHCDDDNDDGDDGDEQNATGFGSKRVRRTVSRNNEADMSKIRDLYRRWVACVRRLAGDTARATVVEAALARDASLAAFRYARSGDSDYKRCFRGG